MLTFLRGQRPQIRCGRPRSVWPDLIQLTAQIEILPMSGTSVAVPLLPLYMAWTEATLPS